MRIKKINLVVKHQDLVHSARYRLSELGIKTISMLIGMIKVSDEDFKEYHIKLSDLKELIGSTSKQTYKYVDIMTDDLMKRPFKIGDEKFNWVYYARYHEGEAYVTLKIAPELKPYLLALSSRFLEYDIANILKLRSGYVIRLYELCIDHWNEGTRYKKERKSVKFELNIDRLRSLFEIPNSYMYKDIRVNIIDKAVEQFKLKTDIQIAYEEQKIGRRVDRLIIEVRANDKGSADPTSSRKKFIERIRATYKPHDGKYPTIATTKQGYLKIDASGRLYLVPAPGTLPGTVDYTPDQADKLWTWLHDMVKSGEIELKENT